MEHLRLPPHIRVEDVLCQLERRRHRVAIVVVRHVVAPVDEIGPRLLGVRQVPAEDVHLPVAPVHLDDRCDERDEVVADVADVRALVHREAVGELHECSRRARLRRVDGARDVIDRRRLGRDPLGLGVIHVDRARVGELRELCPVLLHPREERLRGDGDGDHLAPLLRGADRVDLHARARLREQAHVLVDLLGVRELVRRTGDVAEDGRRRRDRFRRGEVVHERREEEGLRGILADLPRVRLVHRLVRIAPGLGGRALDGGQSRAGGAGLVLRGGAGERAGERRAEGE